jgi:signal transduction histidine kinase
MKPPRFVLRPLRSGLIVNSVLLSVALVVATAFAVGTAIIQAVGQEVEKAADRRIADGATFFRASLDDSREDLFAVGEWLARDRELLAATEEKVPGLIRERLALALRLRAVDEVLVASPEGDVLAQLWVDQSQGEPGANVDESLGFLQALAGRTAAGFARGDAESLHQEVYVPIRPLFGEQPVGVLRLASFLDEKDVDEFRKRTGLDISLFFGEARLVTTLRQADGTPLTTVGPQPDVFRQVVGEGREVAAWRDLPVGRVRSYSAPLATSDGVRVGMASIAVPSSALAGELGNALLRVVPLTALITLASAVLAYLLARRVREPVVSLAAAATRLQAGDLATPIPQVRERELAPLANELERARSSLEAHLRAMAREEARQRALFTALREPILITSAEGRITGCNTAATAQFGDPAQIHGRPVGELLPFVGIPAEEGGQEALWRGSTRDTAGRVLEVEASVTVLDEGSERERRVYVVHDISHHAELNRLREQLLYSVAHELRGPLSVLDNALEILATDYADLPAAQFVELVTSARRTARRLRTLMDDLLSAGSIQSGRFLVSPRPASVAAIVNEALDNVAPMLESRRQQVDLQLPAGGLTALADQRYARQVVSNLVANASKFGPDAAVIRVRAERTTGSVRIAVEDRGPGIPPEEQAGLFEPFYRVPSRKGAPGIGLGLAIAKGIVEAHGGAIGVESEVGVGTTVWFTLPAAAGAA